MASILNTVKAAEQPIITFDRYFRPNISSIFEVVKHEVEAKKLNEEYKVFEEFTKQVKSIKMDGWDGKINVEGWAVCYKCTRNGKPEFYKSYTLKQITEKVVRPDSLKDQVFRSSFLASCAAGKLVIEKPNAEDIVGFFFREISTSFNLASSIQNLQQLEHRESNPMRIFDTIPELALKKVVWMRDIRDFMEILGTPVDEDALEEQLNKEFYEDFVKMESKLDDQDCYVYCNTQRSLERIRDLLEEGIEDGRVKGYLGAPGTGKTYHGIKDSMPKAEIWSLSNTVAFNGAKRAREMDCEVEPFSFSKITALYVMNKEQFIKDRIGKHILIDEMSQLGFSDGCKVLLAALRTSKANNTKVIFMGDLLQIPAFTSRGSFLYSIYKEFPKCFTELTENKRVDPTSREIVEHLQDFSKDGSTKFFDKYSISKTSLDEALEDFGDNSVVIAGSNFQASLVNQIVLSNKITGYVADLAHPDNWFRSFHDYRDSILEYMAYTPIKMRARETNTIVNHTDKKQFKIRRNEEFFCTVFANTSSYETYVRIESTLTTEVKVINYHTFVDQFEPAYAITSAKAQGLEWDNVILMYGDLLSKNDCGVGFKTNYPIRRSFEHFYVGCSRAKKSLSIFYGGMRDTKLTPVEKFNMFDVI